MQFFEDILRQNPCLHAAPLAVELHQLRPLHTLARLLTVAGIVGKEGIPAPLAGCSGDKSIIVRVERRLLHPVYGKVVKRFNKFHAHDEENTAKVGDTVVIMETRPMSKTKRWRLVSVEEK